MSDDLMAAALLSLVALGLGLLLWTVLGRWGAQRRAAKRKSASKAFKNRLGR